MKVIISGNLKLDDKDILEGIIIASGFTVSEVIVCSNYNIDALAFQWASDAGKLIHQRLPAWEDLDGENKVIKLNRQGKPYNSLARIQRNEEICSEADALILVWDGKNEHDRALLHVAEKTNLQVFLKELNAEKLKEKHLSTLQERAKDWAQSMNTSDALVLDTESSGGAKNDEIINISMVKVGNGEVLFDSLLKPSRGVKLNWYAAQVHKITEEQLAAAPKLKEVWKEVFALLDGKSVIAYNASSDKRMIQQTCKKLKLKMPEIDWHCLMKHYAHYTKRSRGVKLSQACEEMNAEAGDHTAKADALAAARLLYRMARGFSPNFEQIDKKKHK